VLLGVETALMVTNDDPIVDVVGVNTMDLGAFAFAEMSVGNVRVTLIIFGSNFVMILPSPLTGSSCLVGEALISSISSSNFMRFGDKSPASFFESFLLATKIGDVSINDEVDVAFDGVVEVNNDVLAIAESVVEGIGVAG
jgi:hypothetical protein